jgi:hypothetical protein
MHEQWMAADSRSLERLAQLDSESVEEVGIARLSLQHAFPSAYGHKLFSGSRLEGSKCNPNFQGTTRHHL